MTSDAIRQEEKRQALSIRRFFSVPKDTSNYFAEKTLKLQENGRPFKLIHEDQAVIYLSKQGDMDLGFNKVVKDKNNEFITCRHLSYFTALKFIKAYHQDLESPEAIGSQEILKLNYFETEYDAFKSSYYGLVPLESLGIQLQSLAQCLEEFEECSFMLHSESHAMSLVIRHKVQGAYSIKFYDPNFTNVHLRLIFKDLNAVASISIDDLLPIHVQKVYFQQFKSGVLLSPLTTTKPPLIEIQEGDAGAHLYFALTYGLSAQVAKLCSKIIQMKGVQTKDKSLLLSVENERGSSGFFNALKQDHLESIKIYIQVIKQLELGWEQKADLLNTKSDQGYPAIFHDFYCQSPDTIKVYIHEIVKHFGDDISGMDLFHELRVASLQGSSFFRPLMENHDEGYALQWLIYTMASVQVPNWIKIDWVAKAFTCIYPKNHVDNTALTRIVSNTFSALDRLRLLKTLGLSEDVLALCVNRTRKGMRFRMVIDFVASECQENQFAMTKDVFKEAAPYAFSNAVRQYQKHIYQAVFNGLMYIGLDTKGALRAAEGRFKSAVPNAVFTGLINLFALRVVYERNPKPQTFFTHQPSIPVNNLEPPVKKRKLIEDADLSIYLN